MAKPLLHKTVSRLARGLDRAFAGTALHPPRRLRTRSGAEGLGHAARMQALSIVASFYVRPAFAAREGAFFARPSAITPQVLRVASAYGRGEVLDLRWPSEFEPLWSRAALEAHSEQLSPADREAMGIDQGSLVHLASRLGIDRNADLREKYLALRANQTAHARWFRHVQGPRPCILLIHGYMAGNYAIEQRMWPLKRLFQSGFDVVLTVLPFHGPRRAESRGYLPPSFPSSDPRFTIEGFRQVVFDHRALFDYLQAGRVTSLGVMGMSLGGYSAGLLATLEAQLQFAVMFVPLASIDEFAYRHGRLVGSEAEQTAQRDALSRAHWPVSPLSRTSLVPKERVIVIGGEADYVTGLAHAERLAEHFGAQLSLFHGGHLWHAGRDQAFEPVWRLLERVRHGSSGVSS